MSNVAANLGPNEKSLLTSFEQASYRVERWEVCGGDGRIKCAVPALMIT
jgi:hypothetical protein